jgi:hypothetical protein
MSKKETTRSSDLDVSIHNQHFTHFQTECNRLVFIDELVSSEQLSWVY